MVFDGDTIALQDGRRIRFLGINTPEVEHKNEPGQAFGAEAAAQLRQWLPKGVSVGLVFDQEKRDKYGRMLAHVYLERGDSLNARLLRLGYAMTLVVPPNQKFIACYDEAERQARDAGRGLWTHADYRPKAADAITDDYDGFAFVSGVVRAVGESRDSVWINYRGDLALRILKTDIANFAAFPLDTLAGKTLTARGWIHPSRRGPRMLIRHPAALRIEGSS